MVRSTGGTGPTLTARQALWRGKWLCAERLEYVDQEGKPRSWECAGRVGDVGAVAVVASFRPSGRLVLVRQFRPPAACFVLEFPAGLVDGDEGFEAAARRELAEETGYAGVVRGVVRPVYSTPGMVSEAVALASVDIDELDPANVSPAQRLDPGEHVEVLLVPATGLLDFLLRRQEAGDGVDAKLMSYALGSQVGGRI